MIFYRVRPVPDRCHENVSGTMQQRPITVSEPKQSPLLRKDISSRNSHLAIFQDGHCWFMRNAQEINGTKILEEQRIPFKKKKLDQLLGLHLERNQAFIVMSSLARSAEGQKSQIVLMAQRLHLGLYLVCVFYFKNSFISFIIFFYLIEL